MDYSQLSDFEINKRVALAAGLSEYMFFDVDEAYARGPVWMAPSGNCYAGIKSSKGNPFDPCNDPADAWPIIHDSLISINFDNDGYDTPKSSWCRATALNGDEYYGDEKRPLRAAMIVFLMMQEANHA